MAFLVALNVSDSLVKSGSRDILAQLRSQVFLPASLPVSSVCVSSLRDKQINKSFLLIRCECEQEAMLVAEDARVLGWMALRGVHRSLFLAVAFCICSLSVGLPVSELIH